MGSTEQRLVHLWLNFLSQIRLTTGLAWVGLGGRTFYGDSWVQAQSRVDTEFSRVLLVLRRDLDIAMFNIQSVLIICSNCVL